jgi:predicted phage terminase large subunit-like protein
VRTRNPATLLLIVVMALLSCAARAAGISLDPISSSRVIASSALIPPELLILLGHSKETRWDLVRRRCEADFLTFVELMWPVLDPGQPFVRGKVQEAIAMHLEAVTAGKIKNLLGNVPPGSTKTYLANVMWPAWEWGPKNRPDLRYFVWSYSPELAQKANDDCRKIIKSEVYQRMWGDRFKLLTGKSDAKSYYENDKGGWRRASSIKGAGTGFRADRLIWDDPHSVADADSAAELEVATRWFARTLPTRVRSAGGEVDIKVPWWVRDVHGDLESDPDDKRPVVETATVGMMQRVALHDISGIILRNPALGYEILLIEMRYRGADHPARKLPTWKGSSIGYQDWRTEPGELADPIRYPESELAKMEAQMISEGKGSGAIAAQFDQWPGEDGGTLFTADWLPIIEPNEAPNGIDKRGWDFAGSEGRKADQTATARVRRGANKRFYLMDSEAMRGGPAKVDDFIRKYHASDPIDLHWSIPRDPGQAGNHQVAYIVRELTAGRSVSSSGEKGKEKSAKPVSSQAEHGNFFIVRHKGCELTRSQMIDFPYGDLDDLMDAISRAFAAHVSRPGTRENHGGFGGVIDAAGMDAAVDGMGTTDWTSGGERNDFDF